MKASYVVMDSAISSRKQQWIKTTNIQPRFPDIFSQTPMIFGSVAPGTSYFIIVTDSLWWANWWKRISNPFL